jgi:basic membrane lipoprotein Med (substrate-binding protein (PBP1-ABC) superfamily)
VTNGAKVIIANSFSQRDAVLKVAPQYADRGVTFLTCAGYDLQPNVGSYFGHMEQAWFVAGRIAAIRAQRSPPRLGVIASFITPEVVRHINAFTLGARSLFPDAVVEVRYLGFWYDYNDTPTWSYKASFMPATEKLFGEELLAAKLIESGCEILAHQADSQRLNKAVDRWLAQGYLAANSVYTMANDNQYGCYQFQGGVRGSPYRNCIGSVYWNWGPMYQNLLDQLHRGVYRPSNLLDSLSENKALSIVGFEPTPNMGVDESALASTLETMAKNGADFVYQGPYESTGQRAPKNVAKGETVHYEPSDPSTTQEWRSMCWFVKGVIVRSDPNDPTSMDIDALVPDGTTTPTVGPGGSILMSPPGLDSGSGLNCTQNH